MELPTTTSCPPWDLCPTLGLGESRCDSQRSLRDSTWLESLATDATLHLTSCRAQLAIQLLNLLLIFLLFFGTYLFQVGLIGELLKEFKGVLFAALAYIAVYSCYAGVKLSYFAGDQISEDNLWGKQAFVAMSVLQKLAALGYYVLILHTTLRLGEAKWYQRGPWVSRYSNQANSVPTMAAGQLQGGSTQLQYSSAPKPMLATQSSSRNFTTTGSQR